MKSIFNFYINSSIHVALAVCSLCALTFLNLDEVLQFNFLGFAFFATVTGYNFVKYAGIAKLHHMSLTESLRTIQIFSFVSFVILMYFTFIMPRELLLGIGCLGMLTLLYALPIFPKANSLRTIRGLKIFIIAIVWAGFAGILPSLYLDSTITHLAIIQTLQYAIFVLAIILPFEIRDVKYDASQLGTIPQRIGIKKTKVLGLALLALIILAEFFKIKLEIANLITLLIICLLAALFIVGSKKEQHKYYASFWVESLPIIWFGLAWVTTFLF